MLGPAFSLNLDRIERKAERRAGALNPALQHGMKAKPK